MSDDYDVEKMWHRHWGPGTPFHRDLHQADLLEWDREAGSVVVRLAYRDSFDNRPDPEDAVIHGGVIASLVDTATGFALAIKAGDLGGPSVDLRVDYLRPARRTALTANAHTVKCGRNIGVADASIFDEAGRLVAVGRQTCFMG